MNSKQKILQKALEKISEFEMCSLDGLNIVDSLSAKEIKEVIDDMKNNHGDIGKEDLYGRARQGTEYALDMIDDMYEKK